MTYHKNMGSEPPLDIERRTYRADILPGILIMFGQHFLKGRKMGIKVGDPFEIIGSLYGGGWRFSVSLRVIARDVDLLRQIHDFLGMELAGRTKRFINENDLGFILVNPSYSGVETISEWPESISAESKRYESTLTLEVESKWNYIEIYPYQSRFFNTEFNLIG